MIFLDTNIIATLASDEKKKKNSNNKKTDILQYLNPKSYQPKNQTENTYVLTVLTRVADRLRGNCLQIILKIILPVKPDLQGAKVPHEICTQRKYRQIIL